MTTTYLDPRHGPPDPTADLDPDMLDAEAIRDEAKTGPILSARFPIFHWATDNPRARTIADALRKDNPYHDELGRFASGPGSSSGKVVPLAGDKMDATRAVASMVRQKFLEDYHSGALSAYAMNQGLNEYQKAWLGQSDWLTSDKAVEAVATNLTSNPNYSQANPSLNREFETKVADAAASLSSVAGLPLDKYDLPVFIVAGGSGFHGLVDPMGSVAETLNENAVIVFGNDPSIPASPNPVFGFKPMAYVQSSNMQDVLIHEYAHAIQDQLPSNAAWETYWADYATSDVRTKGDNGLWNRPSGGLSLYSLENPQEGFAETFVSAIRMSDEQYAALRPEAKSMVDYMRDTVLA